MASINSLMKYRFQKKEGEKLSQQSSQSSEGTQEYEPYRSKESRTTTDSQSPIFSGKKPFAKHSIILSDSDEDELKSQNEQSPSVAFAGSSPWLSKQRMADNSKPRDSKSSLSVNDREFQANLRNIRDMFPDLSRDLLEKALIQTDGDVEAAIDRVIAQKNGLVQEVPRKRKYAIFQTSPSFSSPAKKSRCEEEPAYSSVQTEIRKEHQNGRNWKPSVLSEQISFLRDMFPNIPKEILEITLKENDYDVEKATVELTAYTPAEPVSQTQNVGSIKAFMASRALAKSSSTGASTSYSHNDKRSNKREKSRLIVLDGSESEEEEDVSIVEDADQYDTHSTNKPVLNFLNDATIDELTTINGCSRKKAELIEKLRPFRDWSDLVSKLERNSKALPFYLITECKEVIRLRNNVRALMEKCQRISLELENFVADLAGKTCMDEGDDARGYIVKQPELLSSGMKLAPYQLVGLNWLILMHSQNINGILGDEMGLGKTIQTIAFLAQLLEQNDHGPHLIICPSSTIDNWLRELKIWCPALKVLLYYGSQEERREIRNLVFDGEMEEFNVVVTTYNMASGSAEDRVLFKKLRYHYAIFDEGHMLKNMASIRYQSLMKIQAKRRLLLTGTPLQNNLLELMSLLSFVMPEMFINKTENFKKIFASKGPATSGNDSRGNYERETVEHAKRILKPFFLRRLKSEVLQQLPGKTDSTLRVPMAFEQQDLYDELKKQFVRDVRANKESSLKGQSGSAMMMQLRKAANHHLLHRRHYDDARLHQMAELMLLEPTHQTANIDYVFEDMQVMSDFELHRLCQAYQSLEPFCLSDEEITDSGKFRYLDELLPNVKNKGDRVLLFSQFTMMLDIVEVYMKSRNHRFLRLDGQTPVVERQELIDEFNNNNDIFIFLLSTKAGGLGINLTAANVVVLHDIDFNPYNDKQAEDRCHRLGQCRDVSVFRLISKNTIEEAMLRCAQAKLKLEREVTGLNKDAEDDDSNDVASLLSEALQMKEQD